MKKLTGFGLGVVVLGVLAAAGIEGIGRWAESRTRAFATAHAVSGAWRYTLVSYDRHWLDADAVSEVTFVPPAGPTLPIAIPSVTLRLKHHIVHGPRADHFAAATIHTTPVLDPDAAAVLGPLFGDQDPLTWDTELAFSGAQSGTMASPAVTGSITPPPPAKPVQVVWGGIQGRYTVTADGRGGSADIAIPQATVTAEQGLLHLEGLHVQGQVAGAPGLAVIGDGKGALTLTLVHLETGGQPVADLGTLAITADSQVEQGKARIGEEFSIGLLAFAGTRVEAIDLKLSASDLDAAALDDLAVRARALQAQSPDPVAQMAGLSALLKELAPRFLARKPVVSIENLAATLNGLHAEGRAKAQYVGPGTLEAFDPLHDLEADASVAVPLALAQEVATGVAEHHLQMVAAAQGTAADPAQLAAQAQIQGTATVNQLVASKSVIRDGDTLKAEASLHQGAILVNGAPFQGALPPPGP